MGSGRTKGAAGAVRACTLAVAAMVAAAAGDGRAAVPPAASGSWFDPAHPGHGLSIEVLGDGRAVAYWFVYDRAGAPLHLVIDARVDGRAMRGAAYSGRGMRFGSFDPATLSLPRWGDVEITFAGCAAATLRYDANGESGAGFGAGTIPLERLSSLGGTACGDADFEPIAAGLYTGSYRAPGPGSGTPRSLEAAVDPDGLLWAVPHEAPPGPGWVGLLAPPVVVASRATTGGPPARASGAVLPNLALDPFRRLPSVLQTGEIAATFANDAGSGVSDGGVSRGLASLEVSRSPDVSLAGRLDPAALAGLVFRVRTSSASFSNPVAELRVEADGAACVRLSVGGAGACQLEGRIAVRSSTHRFFDFELLERGGRIYRGRGWVHLDANGAPSRIVLAGRSDDGVGLGFRMDRP